MIEMNIIFGILMFILGTIVGSFLNVCVVRMPLEKSVVRPASHCPSCKKNIEWYNNIPLISYLLLGAKCPNCKAKISFRYFGIEFLTGIIFLVFYWYYGFSLNLWPYLVMMSCFVVATFVDFEHRIIPDEISVGGMCLGLVFSAFLPSLHGIDVASGPWYKTHALSLGLSLLGVLIGGGLIYLMGVLGDFLFKKESMGGGDIKLLAMIGAFLGWEKAILTFFIAPFFGAVFGIIEKIRTKDSAIAYGPFLVLGAIISLFAGDQIIDFVMNGLVF